MHPNRLLTIVFILSFILGMFGAVLKLMHWPGGVAVQEIISSVYIKKSEKIIWPFGMLMMSGIVSIIYMLVGRRRVTGESQYNSYQ